MPVARVFGSYSQTHNFPTTQGANGRIMQHTVTSTETSRDAVYAINHAPGLSTVTVDGHRFTVPKDQTFADNTQYSGDVLYGRVQTRQLTSSSPIAIRFQPEDLKIEYSALPSLRVTLELPYGGYLGRNRNGNMVKAEGRATIATDGTVHVAATFPELYDSYSPLANAIKGSFKVAANGTLSDAEFIYKNHTVKQTAASKVLPGAPVRLPLSAGNNYASVLDVTTVTSVNNIAGTRSAMSKQHMKIAFPANSAGPVVSFRGVESIRLSPTGTAGVFQGTGFGGKLRIELDANFGRVKTNLLNSNGSGSVNEMGLGTVGPG